MAKPLWKIWWWLHEHPMFVDPNSPKFMMTDMRRLVDIAALKDGILIEAGPYSYCEEMTGPNKYVPSHDHKLDAWGDTFEEAVRKFARNVKKHYGDHGEITHCRQCGISCDTGKKKTKWKKQRFFCSKKCAKLGATQSWICRGPKTDKKKGEWCGFFFGSDAEKDAHLKKNPDHRPKCWLKDNGSPAIIVPVLKPIKD
jgi:hypothetical protein